jgi:hypothetical protein
VFFGLSDGQLLTFEKRSQSFTQRKVATGRINALLRSAKSDVLYASTSLGEIVMISLGDQQITTASLCNK